MEVILRFREIFCNTFFNRPAVIEPVCSAVQNCTCDKEQFAPICGVDGKIYISSCHAGCSVADLRNEDNHTVFAQCSCIEDCKFVVENNEYFFVILMFSISSIYG